MKETLKRILKNVLVIAIYFIYIYIVIAALSLLNIDYSSFDYKYKLITIGIADICFIVLLLFWVYKKELIEDFKDFKINYKQYISKYIILYFIGVILMGVINVIISHFTGMETSGNEADVRLLVEKFPIYMTFSTIIYAPFVEEIIFRKAIRNIFKNKYLFIILSGVIFGCAHISDYTNINDILFSIGYIVMGIDFAYIYYKTNNIYTTMSFHMIHNLLLLIIQFII